VIRAFYRHISFKMAIDTDRVALVHVEFDWIHDASFTFGSYVLLRIVVASFTSDAGVKKRFTAV
jgi:hypothetical protein